MTRLLSPNKHICRQSFIVPLQTIGCIFRFYYRMAIITKKFRTKCGICEHATFVDMQRNYFDMHLT